MAFTTAVFTFSQQPVLQMHDRTLAELAKCLRALKPVVTPRPGDPADDAVAPHDLEIPAETVGEESLTARAQTWIEPAARRRTHR
jgi:hypothetical protein